MNCRESQELIQHCLDGEPADPARDDFVAHLDTCPECHEQYAAAQCLLDGLQFLHGARPPAGLSERICRQVMIERSRLKRLRRGMVASAVAATFLLAWLAGYRASPPASVDPPVEHARVQQLYSPRPALSLHRRIREAGESIVALTRRTADDVSASGAALAPGVLGALTQPRVPASETEAEKTLGQAVVPSTQSLRVVQQDMLASLEPMAVSARRAIDFFLHEISAMENNVQ